MTTEEREKYNRLPKADQEEYDHLLRKHPNWDHKQIMAKVAFNRKADDMIEKKGGEDINPDDPSVLEEILKGAKEFLIGVGIFIEDVFEVIDDALTALGDLIADGVSYIGNKLKDFWDWLRG